MIVGVQKINRFMFAEKDVCHPYINIGGGGEHGKHTFPQAFTMEKLDVSQVCQYAKIGEHRKLTNTPTRSNSQMMGKGVRR